MAGIPLLRSIGTGPELVLWIDSGYFEKDVDCISSKCENYSHVDRLHMGVEVQERTAVTSTFSLPLTRDRVLLPSIYVSVLSLLHISTSTPFLSLFLGCRVGI